MKNRTENVDPVLSDPAINWMMKDIGVDLGEAAPVIHEYVDRVGAIESDLNPKAANKESSARGMFQWLTKNKRNAFQDDLKGAELYYKKSGSEVPQWVKDAQESNDPTELTAAEQKKLFLFRMYRVADNAQLKEAYTGNREAQRDLYFKKHHTNPDEATFRRVDQILPTLEDATEAAAPGMPADMDNMAPAVATDQTVPPTDYTGAALDLFRNDPFNKGNKGMLSF